MLKTTRDAIRSILATDPTIPTAERSQILTSLDHPATTTGATPRRILRRAEVAKLLSCTTRTVDTLARSGTLRRIHFPGRKQGAGFNLADVEALLDGAGGKAAA
jgi:hypothetical protein